MKIVVLNGSPKGETSVTMQYVAWVQKKFPQHELKIINIAQRIKSIEKDEESFQEIIAHLRAPDGCPWDREQTHQTLRPNLLEEAFEALEAIDADDPEAMQEEFGDLLLQIVLHAQISSEYGEFTMSDIIQGIHTKLIHRHPHVFNDLDLEEPDSVLKNWEAIKAQDREVNGELLGEYHADASA